MMFSSVMGKVLIRRTLWIVLKPGRLKSKNDEVYVYRIYSGSTIEYLTVHPLELLDRVGITGLTEYEMGYLNSYFYQIYQSGEIE